MKLYEALIKDDEYKLHYNQVAKEAEKNRLMRRVFQSGMKEGLFSDMAQAIGAIHDRIIGAAYPNAIARDIIAVAQTKESRERFIKEAGARAYVASEAGGIKVVPAKYSYVDITPDIIIKGASEWTQELVEDATWNVMERQLQVLGKEVASKELEKVLALYDAVSATDLAGGSEINNGGASFDWAAIRKLWHTLSKENYTPTVLFTHPTHVAQLLGDDKFINANYLPSRETDVRRGVIGEVLGMRVVTSTAITEGKAYAVDLNVAAVMLVRRDLTSKPYEDPKKDVYGIVCTERIGLGVLVTKAIARMTNIGTTI